MATKLTPMQKLNKLKHNQTQYLTSVGGPFEMKEGDEVYNNLTRHIISAYAAAHPHSYVGDINIYGEQRSNVAAGKASPLKAYKGEKIYNFGCDFIVPMRDQTLEELLRDYNAAWSATTSVTDLLDEIIKRIYKIGGELLLWT